MFKIRLFVITPVTSFVITELAVIRRGAHLTRLELINFVLHVKGYDKLKPF
jgi:hypothetical protein